MATSAELMRDIVGWDVRTWSRAVRFWESRLDDSGRTLRCLEVGAGPGGPSLWLRLRGHEVITSNWQNTELQAGPLHEKYAVADEITYEDIDVTSIPYENHFDLVVFKSVIGGVVPHSIEMQQRAMHEIRKSLKPGGMLIFAENLKATPLHQLARFFAYRRRSATWRYLTVAELRGLLEQFSSSELYTTGFISMFGLREKQRSMLAAIDERVGDRLTPEALRYVAYGVATK